MFNIGIRSNNDLVRYFKYLSVVALGQDAVYQSGIASDSQFRYVFPLFAESGKPAAVDKRGVYQIRLI